VRFLALGLIAALYGAALPAQTAPKRSSKKATSSKSKKKTAVVRRVAQQQPTPERYKEIQQALADKGYFHGAVDGAWGADSTDALKRFQREQNLEDDGKIGSLSLIALGLGPQR
jgi:peptidoglycan hydrolase-like protein with peptidoglycan-binding domain